MVAVRFSTPCAGFVFSTVNYHRITYMGKLRADPLVLKMTLAKGVETRVASVRLLNDETRSVNTVDIQGDSVARGPKLLSIKNYVIEIMT